LKSFRKIKISNRRFIFCIILLTFFLFYKTTNEQFNYFQTIPKSPASGRVVAIFVLEISASTCPLLGEGKKPRLHPQAGRQNKGLPKAQEIHD
jgi:hypothetical protein